MYAPMIQSAKPNKRYKCGPYSIVFWDHVVANGLIEYEFIITVFATDAKDPFLLVTSEKNKTGIAIGSHFLCLWDEQGHHNLGSSDAWAKAQAFEARALQILTERLGAIPAAI